MSTPQPQSVNLSALPTAKTMGKISISTVDFGGKRAMHVTVNPGGAWSKDLKEHHGTDSCQKSHLGFVLSGKMGVRMDDGTEAVMEPNDLFHVPPGHDAWCVGDEPGVFVEFAVDGA